MKSKRLWISCIALMVVFMSGQAMSVPKKDLPDHFYNQDQNGNGVNNNSTPDWVNGPGNRGQGWRDSESPIISISNADPVSVPVPQTIWLMIPFLLWFGKRAHSGSRKV